MSSSAAEVQGVLLQEIPDARVFQRFQGDGDVEVAHGALRVLMVSVPVVNPFGNESSTSGKEKVQVNNSEDLWLALEIGSEFSLPVKASQTVVPDRRNASYTFPSPDVPGAAILLKLNGSNSSAVRQFEELLIDYCAFPSEQKGQGSLELLDEKGQLLGTIDGPWQLEEDPAIHSPGHEKDPVLFELPDQDGTAAAGSSQHVRVQAAPRDENGQLPEGYQKDWLLRGAQYISKSLEKGSVWAGTKMLKGAESYVARTTPPTSNRTSIDNDVKRGSFSEKNQSGSQLQQDAETNSNLTASGHRPVTFSPQTQNAANSVRNVSGKVCSISNRTSAAVLNAAGNLGSQIGKKTGIQQRTAPDGEAKTPTGFRGALNRSLVAFNVVLDGVTNSAERLIKDGGEASGRMIEHRYGSEAKVISGNVASVGRSAFVVYKDINGVRRKALLKVATGTIRARAPDGGEVVLQQQGIGPVRAEGLSEKSPTSGSGGVEPPPYKVDSQQVATFDAEKKRRNDEAEGLAASCISITFPPTPHRYRHVAAPSITDTPVPPRSFTGSEYDVFSGLTTLHDGMPSSDLGMTPTSLGVPSRQHNTPSLKPYTFAVDLDVDKGFDHDAFSSPSADRMRRYGHQEKEELPNAFFADWCCTPTLKGSFGCGLAEIDEINGLSLHASNQSGASPEMHGQHRSGQQTPLADEGDGEKDNGDAYMLLSLSSQYAAVEEMPWKQCTANAPIQDAVAVLKGYQSHGRLDAELSRPLPDYAFDLDRACMTGGAAVNAQQIVPIHGNLDRGGGGEDGDVTAQSYGVDPCLKVDTGDHAKLSSATVRNPNPHSAVSRIRTAAPHSHATSFTPDDNFVPQVSPRPPPSPCSHPLTNVGRAPLSSFVEAIHAHQTSDSPIDALALRGGQRSPSRQSWSLPSTVTPRRLSKRHMDGVSVYEQEVKVESGSRSDLSALLSTITTTPDLPRHSDMDAAFKFDSTTCRPGVSAGQDMPPTYMGDGSSFHHPGFEDGSKALSLQCDSWTSGASEETSSPVSSTCFGSPLQTFNALRPPTIPQPFVKEWSDLRTARPSSEAGHGFHPNEDQQSSPLSSVDAEYHQLAKKGQLGSEDRYVSKAHPPKRRRIVARLNRRSDHEARCKDQGSPPSKPAMIEPKGQSKPFHGCPTTDGSEKDDEEGVACILLSLGSNSSRVHQHHVRATERAQRAVRRNVYINSNVTRTGSAVASSYGPRKRKVVTARVSDELIAPYVQDDGAAGDAAAQMTSADNVLIENGVREFPADMPKLLDKFPLWYRRFHVPTPMNAGARAAIFGVRDDADAIKDERVRAAYQRSCRQFPIWKEPDHLLDLYTPRWMRSVGRDKEAMCTVCYEEGGGGGVVRFLKTKTSQYNYHLINQHGISPLTRRPFDPPVDFRTVRVAKAGSHERQVMLQGRCHACSRFVDLQSVRDGHVNVPEIYWWKHASQCHKRDGTSFDSGHIFVQNEIYTRTLAYIDSKESASDPIIVST